MDPTACHRAMTDAANDSNCSIEERAGFALQHAEALIGWLRGGGPPPEGMTHEAALSEAKLVRMLARVALECCD